MNLSSRCTYREAMSTIWRTWTQRSGLYTNDNEVLTHLYRRFKLEVDNRRWFDSSWIEQRVNRRWKNSTVLQVAWGYLYVWAAHRPCKVECFLRVHKRMVDKYLPNIVVLWKLVEPRRSPQWVIQEIRNGLDWPIRTFQKERYLLIMTSS